MGGVVRIDTAGIETAINLLRSQAGVIESARGRLAGSPLQTFSAASGFREAGSKLGSVSAHRAPEAHSVLASHLTDAATILEINLKNTLLADGSWAKALEDVRVPGNLNYHGVMGAYQANAQAVNARANSFAPHSPAVAPEPSLLALHTKLSASQLAAPATDAAVWETVAGQLGLAVQQLFDVHRALAASADTDWVQRGGQRVNRIQRAGAAYAANAGQLAAHTAALGSVIGAESVYAAAAAATYAAIPDPAARKVFEQTYLAAYPPRAASGLATTVPAFTKLIPDLNAVTGDPFRIGELSQPQSPEFDRSPLPQVVSEALQAHGHGDLARLSTPAEVVSAYGHPNPDLLKAIVAGATPTQAAAAAAPHLPPTLHPALLSTSAVGFDGHLPGLGAGAGLASGAGAGAGLASGAGAGVGAGAAAAPALGALSPLRGQQSPAARAASASAGAAPAPAAQRGAASTPAPVGPVATGGGRHRAPAAAGPAPTAGRGTGVTPASHVPVTAASAERAGQSQAGAGTWPAGAGIGAPAGAQSRGGRDVGSAAGRGVGGAGAGAVGASGGPGSLGSLSGFGGGSGARGAGSALGAGAAGFAAGGFGHVPGGAPGAAPGGLGSASGVGGALGSTHGGTGAGGGAGAGQHGAGMGQSALRGTAGAFPVGTGAPMGGAPMGAGAGAGGANRKGGSKVKSVTSAVEREGNLRALLGEAPLVLPPVIGAEVRG